ncbi:hypothetical protein UO65_4614 [Actinokineospora spheciospongiae]|uniref:Uncharacterized protein n=1 Tax=Actinokineospora spheciospongiae TaxID=909613 RepID=W7II45_9PSEU|nr:hypothetical protein [Actinokineospora spheciospongiae]EWC60048.1 hypothetical protein UO65_4614 [Actinokineospora spheciospongiae]
MIEEMVLDWATGADELVDEFLDALGDGEVVELNVDTSGFCDEVAPEDDNRVRAALAAPGQAGYAVVRHGREHFVIVAHAVGAVIGRVPQRTHFFGRAGVPGSGAEHAAGDDATLCGAETFTHYRSPFSPYSPSACSRCRDEVLAVFGLPDPPGPVAEVVAGTPPGPLRDTLSEILSEGARTSGWSELTADDREAARLDDLVEGRAAATALSLAHRAVATARVEDPNGDFLVLVSRHDTVLARHATGGGWDPTR